jgi:hypothetical protein
MVSVVALLAPAQELWALRVLGDVKILTFHDPAGTAARLSAKCPCPSLCTGPRFPPANFGLE